ncbi:MAG: DUF433 domain-containing protein [Gemmatimonadota bacterium]
MRALHQVVTRTEGVRAGAAVFAGTRVPVRSLMEHFDRGGDLDGFLAKHASVRPDVALAACALGLEALLEGVPLDPGPPQRSLLPRLDSAGIIQNAEELSAKQVIGKRVLCPACRSLVFKAWPEGWDSHAERRCRGLSVKGGTERKEEFRRKYGYLFRS